MQQGPHAHSQLHAAAARDSRRESRLGVGRAGAAGQPLARRGLKSKVADAQLGQERLCLGHVHLQAAGGGLPGGAQAQALHLQGVVCVCVCACGCVCVHVCVCARVCVRVHVYVNMCERMCVVVCARSGRRALLWRWGAVWRALWVAD